MINTLVSMYFSKAYKEGVSPVFYAGLILVIAGAATVLVFAPKAHKPPIKEPTAAAGKLLPEKPGDRAS